MAIFRVQAVWTGFTGGPGYSSFHFAEEGTPGYDPAMRDAVVDFFDGIQSLMPTTFRVNVSREIEVYDSATGTLTGYENDESGQGGVTGSGSGGYVGPAGAVVTWNTNTVSNGRRVRGRTFLVPLRTAAFEADGTLSTNALNSINAAASVLSSPTFAHNFVIFSRRGGGQAPVVAPVVSHRVPDMAAVLRSRRD